MTQKKLRRKTLPQSSLSEVEEFVEEFRNALARGEFDAYLYELVEAVDGRTADMMGFSAEEQDANVTAFLNRLRHMRVGPPVLEEEACYTLLGAEYHGVIVRYIEPYEDKARVEVVSNPHRGKLIGPAAKLAEGSTYRVPKSAIDRKVDEPEGK